QRARSRARKDAIAAEIVGALLDFPELLDKPEILAYAEQVEGDLAAALAALRQSAARAEPFLASQPTDAVVSTHAESATDSEARGRHSGIVHLQAALAKMPLSIQPFAIARMAAPRHQRVEDAEAELVVNMRKLQQLEASRIAFETQGDLERARRAGDFEQELNLLLELEHRARQRRGL